MKRLILLIGLWAQTITAQDTKIAFTASYAYQIPMGDLAVNYGNNSNTSANVNIKLKNNFTFGVEGQFIFGSSYSDFNLLGSIVTNGGFIVGKDQSIQVPEIEGRGGNFFGEIGKIFPVNKSNLNSGIHLKLGVGHMFYTAFTNANLSAVPQLLGNYKDGYNRYQSGMSYNTFLGYTYYGSDKLMNFSAGVQMTYASMKYNGTIDFATGKSYEGHAPTSNFLIGPKLSFSVMLKTIERKDPKADGYYYN